MAWNKIFIKFRPHLTFYWIYFYKEILTFIDWAYCDFKTSYSKGKNVYYQW